MRAGRKITDLSPKGRQSRRLYAARVLTGVCVNNRAHIAEPGQVMCLTCQRKGRAANRAWVRVHRINGECRECPNLLAPGEIARCKACRDRRKQRPSRKHAYRVRNERGYVAATRRAA